jgi:hypothetical protein
MACSRDNFTFLPLLINTSVNAVLYICRIIHFNWLPHSRVYSVFTSYLLHLLYYTYCIARMKDWGKIGKERQCRWLTWRTTSWKDFELDIMSTDCYTYVFSCSRNSLIPYIIKFLVCIRSLCIDIIYCVFYTEASLLLPFISSVGPHHTSVQDLILQSNANQREL